MTIDEKEINSILDGHDKKKSDLKKQAEQEHEKFLAAHKIAARIEKEIVLPSVTKIAGILKSRGHDCKIKEEVSPNSYYPSITLEVVQKEPFSISKLAFRFSPLEGIVEVIPEELTGTNRPSRSTNIKFKFNELTQEIVDKELVSFLKNIL